jgi:hypothetical protein
LSDAGRAGEDAGGFPDGLQAKPLEEAEDTGRLPQAAQRVHVRGGGYAQHLSSLGSEARSWLVSEPDQVTGSQQPQWFSALSRCNTSPSAFARSFVS